MIGEWVYPELWAGCLGAWWSQNGDTAKLFDACQQNHADASDGDLIDDEGWCYDFTSTSDRMPLDNLATISGDVTFSLWISG